MPTLFASCHYDQLALERLSDKALLQKNVKNRRMGGFGLMLLVLLVGMAFVVEPYLLAITSWPIMLVLDEYEKKRKAINKQLQKRSLI